MIIFDEEALICDLAETYHIYDYKQLPPSRIAVFSCGLRDDSRIKMKLSNQSVSLDKLLLASISDRLGILVWAKTKDAQKGRNRPLSILDSFTKTKSERKEIVFSSGEDFEKERNRLMSGIGGED